MDLAAHFETVERLIAQGCVSWSQGQYERVKTILVTQTFLPKGCRPRFGKTDQSLLRRFFGLHDVNKRFCDLGYYMILEILAFLDFKELIMINLVDTELRDMMSSNGMNLMKPFIGVFPKDIVGRLPTDASVDKTSWWDRLLMYGLCANCEKRPREIKNYGWSSVSFKCRKCSPLADCQLTGPVAREFYYIPPVWGREDWYRVGRPHRVDGPATIYPPEHYPEVLVHRGEHGFAFIDYRDYVNDGGDVALIHARTYPHIDRKDDTMIHTMPFLLFPDYHGESKEVAEAVQKQSRVVAHESQRKAHKRTRRGKIIKRGRTDMRRVRGGSRVKHR